MGELEPRTVSQLARRIQKLEENKNPDTVKAQLELINRIHITEIADLPPTIHDAVERYQHGRTGEHILELPHQEELRVTKLPNGILDIRHLKKSSHRILWLDTYELTQQAIVDTIHQKAFDASQLWRGDGNQQPLTILVLPQLSDASFAQTRDGGIVLLGNFQASKERSPDRAIFLNRIALPHEVGHALQVLDNTSKFTPTTLVVFRAVQPLLKVIRDAGAVFHRYTPKEKDARRELAIRVKTHKAWEERNAMAFTLAFFRKLASLGVDVFRGQTESQIRDGIDHALATRDSNKLLSTEYPASILSSQKYRRRRRGMDKTYYAVKQQPPLTIQ